MTAQGVMLIAGEAVAGTAPLFRAIDPRTGTAIGAEFGSATPADIDRACRGAEAVFDEYRALAPMRRAQLLDAIAERIEEAAESIVACASHETGLPPARLQGELARTTGQLRQFAALLGDFGWAEPCIIAADPERVPLPRPDLRRRNIGVGPVAVFGASNFPLAYSVAGGDTASALAAGCPVVVKGHPAHPGTSELVARAVCAAVAACGLPSGVFSLVNGAGTEQGAALVAHPAIQSVGFTGSRAGGVALMRIAAARPVPIPVHAEMGSINPVFLLPRALGDRGAAIAEGYVASLTASAGQFCTSPGIVIGCSGAAWDAFCARAAELLPGIAPAPMLTPGIHAAYQSGLTRLIGHPDVAEVGRGDGGAGPHDCAAALFRTDAASFIADGGLAEENFGASSLLVTCRDAGEMQAVAEALEGQLTATLHADQADMDLARDLLPIVERKVGRIILNGWPTGVEVNAAMVHGGPFPASSDGRTSAVGPLAIRRFLRPVAYQNFTDELLPAELTR